MVCCGRLHYQLLRALQLGLACHRAAVDDWILNLALVRAPLNLEETVVPPVSIPTVGHLDCEHAWEVA